MIFWVLFNSRSGWDGLAGTSPSAAREWRAQVRCVNESALILERLTYTWTCSPFVRENRDPHTTDVILRCLLRTAANKSHPSNLTPTRPRVLFHLGNPLLPLSQPRHYNSLN